MGMPYAAGAIPGQMYNSTTGYPAQQNALGSKAPYTAQNANKVRNSIFLKIIACLICDTEAAAVWQLFWTWIRESAVQPA